jgi:predicted XRE-type DNA-binding protein
MIDETKIEYEEGSGNVFADLGLEDADELLTRAKLGYSVRQIVKKRGLKQREIAKILDLKQPEVSNLMQGKYHLFSEGRLFSFLNKLDQKIIVQVIRRKKNDPLQEVVFTP